MPCVVVWFRSLRALFASGDQIDISSRVAIVMIMEVRLYLSLFNIKIYATAIWNAVVAIIWNSTFILVYSIYVYLILFGSNMKWDGIAFKVVTVLLLEWVLWMARADREHNNCHSKFDTLWHGVRAWSASAHNPRQRKTQSTILRCSSI